MSEQISSENGGKQMSLTEENEIPKFTGKSLTDFLTEELGIRITMLAALLSVRERTLNNWKELEYNNHSVKKFHRLEVLYDLVVLAKQYEVPTKLVLNLVKEPMGENEDDSSILSFIIDDPYNGLITPFFEKELKEAKGVLSARKMDQ